MRGSAAAREAPAASPLVARVDDVFVAVADFFAVTLVAAGFDVVVVADPFFAPAFFVAAFFVAAFFVAGFFVAAGVLADVFVVAVFLDIRHSVR